LEDKQDGRIILKWIQQAQNHDVKHLISITSQIVIATVFTCEIYFLFWLQLKLQIRIKAQIRARTKVRQMRHYEDNTHPMTSTETLESKVYGIILSTKCKRRPFNNI